MTKSALKIILPVFFVSIFWCDISEAGGAAARNRGVRVHRTIRPVPPPARSEDHPDAPQPEKERETKKPEARQAPLPIYREPRVLQSSAAPGSRVISSAPAAVDDRPSSLEEELARIFSYLRNSSEIWPQIGDPRIKMLIVGRHIDLYRREGAVIQKPALYYVQMIDSMARNNPAMLGRPFDEILRTAAVLEYDFDNGQNKDGLALQVLGSREAVVENRRRLMRMQQGR